MTTNSSNLDALEEDHAADLADDDEDDLYSDVDSANPATRPAPLEDPRKGPVVRADIPTTQEVEDFMGLVEIEGNVRVSAETRRLISWAKPTGLNLAPELVEHINTLSYNLGDPRNRAALAMLHARVLRAAKEAMPLAGPVTTYSERQLHDGSVEVRERDGSTRIVSRGEQADLKRTRRDRSVAPKVAGLTLEEFMAQAPSTPAARAAWLRAAKKADPEAFRKLRDSGEPPLHGGH